MANPFQNAVAVVTGGALGLGKADPLQARGVDVAAREVLRGVERDKAVIVFPFYARLLWWLTRLNPGIVVAINRKTARDFRRRVRQ